MREFAASRGVSPATIYWWRSRLGHVRGGGKHRDTEGCELVPVAVTEPPLPAPTGDCFELQFRSDLLLRIPRGFEAGDLRRILSVVREPC